MTQLALLPTYEPVPETTSALDPGHGDATAARRAIAAVLNNGRLVVASLRALMGPAAPIAVATVYDPSDGSGDAGRLGLPPWPQVLELLAELNRALRTLADEHQVLVAEVHARFLGHGLAAGNPVQPAARPIVACGTAS